MTGMITDRIGPRDALLQITRQRQVFRVKETLVYG